MAEETGKALVGAGAAVERGDPNWQRRSQCLAEGTPPEVMFPPKGAQMAHVAAAKAVCGRCEVASACLSYAVSTRQRFGVWGGMTERERRPLVRAARALPQRGPTVRP